MDINFNKNIWYPLISIYWKDFDIGDILVNIENILMIPKFIISFMKNIKIDYKAFMNNLFDVLGLHDFDVCVAIII